MMFIVAKNASPAYFAILGKKNNKKWFTVDSAAGTPVGKMIKLPVFFSTRAEAKEWADKANAYFPGGHYGVVALLTEKTASVDTINSKPVTETAVASPETVEVSPPVVQSNAQV